MKPDVPEEATDTKEGDLLPAWERSFTMSTDFAAGLAGSARRPSPARRSCRGLNMAGRLGKSPSDDSSGNVGLFGSSEIWDEREKIQHAREAYCLIPTRPSAGEWQMASATTGLLLLGLHLFRCESSDSNHHDLLDYNLSQSQSHQGMHTMCGRYCALHEDIIRTTEVPVGSVAEWRASGK